MDDEILQQLMRMFFDAESPYSGIDELLESVCNYEEGWPWSELILTITQASERLPADIQRLGRLGYDRQVAKAAAEWKKQGLRPISPDPAADLLQSLRQVLAASSANKQITHARAESKASEYWQQPLKIFLFCSRMTYSLKI
jgi:hypothetical protein